MLLSTHLFKDLKTINRDDLSSLYAVACATTQEVLEFDNAYDLKSYGTAYLWWSLLLSITVLLRILKTDLSKRVHQQDGAELFLAGLSNFSLWSIAYGDKTARIADAFGKLWRSDKVFKQSDGSSNVRLRVRTRLAMSLVFDLMVRFTAPPILWCLSLIFIVMAPARIWWSVSRVRECGRERLV